MENKKIQTCQHDQQLYGNEYNSYLLMIEYPQLNNGDSLLVAGVEDIWLLYKVYNAIPFSPNSFRGKKEIKKTQNQQGFYSSLPLSQIF